MRGNKLVDAAITSSLLETVSISAPFLCMTAFTGFVLSLGGSLRNLGLECLGGLGDSQVCEVVQVESSDLINYGLIPEFIGRFPVLVSLAALNEEQLVQVTPALRLDSSILRE